MNKNILVETQLFKPQILNEGKVSTSDFIVEAPLATVDKPNGNGRYYSRDLWEREINNYISGPIKEGRSTGELDHSDDEVINLKNISHLITKVWWDGDNIMGRIKILPTPSGNILRTLIENKVLVGVSSRGLGSVEEKGELLEVQDDFSLICWDFVSTPSNANSWVKPVLNENKLYLKQQNKYNKVNKIISDIIFNL